MKGLFVGVSIVDIQLYINEFPRSNTKNKALSARFDIGGPATNAAITFAILGGKAKLVTKIGQHEFRGYMLKKLKEYRVEVVDLIEDISGDPDFSVIISSLNNGDRTVFESHALKEQKTMHDKIPEDFDICLVDGFLTEVTNWITSIAKNSGKITVLDGGSWKTGMEKYLSNIDYAVCSSDFFPPGCKSHDEIISFLKNTGIKNIAITRGEKSIIIFEEGRKKELHVKEVNAIDTLGAGDVFHGALCYYLLREYNFVTAMKRASDIASESCKYHGTKEWADKSDESVST